MSKSNPKPDGEAVTPQSFKSSPNAAASWRDPESSAVVSRALSNAVGSSISNLPALDSAFYEGLSKLKLGGPFIDSGVIEAVTKLTNQNAGLGVVSALNGVLASMPEMPSAYASMVAGLAAMPEMPSAYASMVAGLAAMPDMGNIVGTPSLINSNAASSLGGVIAPLQFAGSPSSILDAGVIRALGMSDAIQSAGLAIEPLSLAETVVPVLKGLEPADYALTPLRAPVRGRVVPASVEVMEYAVTAEVGAAPETLQRMLDVLVESVAATKAAEDRANRADRRTFLIACVGIGVAIVFGLLPLLF